MKCGSPRLASSSSSSSSQPHSQNREFTWLCLICIFVSPRLLLVMEILVQTDDTNTLNYWLNWRFFLCALLVFTCMLVASFLIWKFEGKRQKPGLGSRENRKEAVGTLYEDETWKTCLKGIHPAWLLGFRIIAFIVLFSLIAADVAIAGVGIFYYYTQWTFLLVTFYFGLGSSLSIYQICKHRDVAVCDETEYTYLEAEQGTYVAPVLEEITLKSLHNCEQPYFQRSAGVWSYVFQITFQICAGSVLLTDIVFWLVLYPLLSAKDYGLSFTQVTMHSINVVFLLGDTVLNRMRFPMFRIAYFMLWTAIFVIFQWAIHAFVPLWWPYPFLDISSSYAPLWYLAVAVMHIPCYGIFALVVRLKNFWSSTAFPEVYQG